MRHAVWATWVTWVTWATCAAPAAAAEWCPAQCSCGAGDELDYACAVGDATVSVAARPLDYVNIDCEGGALTCADFPYLPLGGNRTLPSLSIRECSLPDPLLCVLGRVGATGVDVLVLKNVSTALEGRHVGGLGVSKLMMFTAEAQKSIPVEALLSLPSLRHFRLCGASVQITPGQFLRCPPLSYLELATDGISALPPDGFKGLDQLKVLNLWGNNLTHISEDALRGLSSLEELYLSTSRARALPALLLAPAPALRTLSVLRNELGALPRALLRDLRHLQQVTISNDAPLTIEPDAFSSLPSLTSLKLSAASLSALPASALRNSTALVNLTLSHNKLRVLPDELFQGLDSLERLDLSYNKIESVSNQLFVGLKALKELKMDANYIEELPDLLFAGLRRLDSVSMSHNRLRHIQPRAFHGPDSLRRVSLSRNSLTLHADPPAQYYDLEQYSPFNSLLRLRVLDLAGNNVSVVFADWRNVLLDLTLLDLSYNSFEELTAADVQFLSSQVVVDLRHNNITTISLAPGYYLQQEQQDQQEQHASILLDHNPLYCDCRLYEAARRLRGARPLTAEPSLELNDTNCASPPTLQGLKFSSVPLDEFTCGIDCNNCDCLIRPATDALDLDCSNDSSIPDPRDYGLSRGILKLRHLPTDLSILPDYVTVLNLSGLGLKSTPRSVPTSLELLDLSNNKLEEFPIKLLEKNVSLKLSGNLFICECATVQQIALMNKFSLQIVDWQSVKCRDGAYMWRVEVDKLCLLQRAALLGGVLATLGIVLAAAAVLMHRYSVEIRIYLTNRGLLCCLSDEYDTDKRYDVFVSFAHDDEVFVIDKLLPKLEVDYRVCVHHRDWRVGDLIPAQIARSVEESRRTLIVLSRRFLASTWGMLEFRAAHVQAAREKKVRVVVLLLEELADVELDRELQAYLSTNTYIKWGDPWFWEKLQYALPRQTRAEEVRSDKRAKTAADNMLRGGLQVTLTADGKLVNNVNKSAA